MAGDLVSDRFRILGELKDAGRPGMNLALSLVTGELVLLAIPGSRNRNQRPTAGELRQEGSVFGEIVSPQVMGIVDWDPEEPYIAWEYVAAWPLSAVLRTTPRPDVAAVLMLMIDVATGLAAVHARGAVYRGLHPARILVHRDGSARLATTPDAVLAATARTGESGPPVDMPVAYLAPEQITGVARASSDLYSLGVIAFELLTGQRLVPQGDPAGQASQVLASDPPLPSSVRDDVPEEVDALIVGLVARDPASRPASADVLLEELHGLTMGAVVPDVDPLASYLSIQPVIHPVLAEDAAEGEIYAALQRSVVPVEMEGGENGDGPAVPGIARRAYRSAARQGSSAERLESGRQGRLVGPGGEVFPLTGRRVVVGRRGAEGPVPDIDLAAVDDHKVVSREHAVLDFGEGRWYVSELRARNGTWLNGERVRKGSFLRLRRGDQLKVANIVLSYTIAEPGEWPTPEPQLAAT